MFPLLIFLFAPHDPPIFSQGLSTSDLYANTSLTAKTPLQNFVIKEKMVQ